MGEMIYTENKNSTKKRRKLENDVLYKMDRIIGHFNEKKDFFSVGYLAFFVIVVTTF